MSLVPGLSARWHRLPVPGVDETSGDMTQQPAGTVESARLTTINLVSAVAFILGGSLFALGAVHRPARRERSGNCQHHLPGRWVLLQPRRLELGPDDLDRIVDRQWNPTVTLGVRLVSVADDCLQHVGQAAYVRGLLEG